MTTRAALRIAFALATLGASGAACGQAPAREPFGPCLMPGTPAAVAAAALARVPSSSADFDLGTRWSATAMTPGPLVPGQRTVVTWSIVPDGTPVPSSIFNDPAGPSTLRATLASRFGAEATWSAIVQGMMTRWSEVGGVVLVYEPNDDGVPIESAPGLAGVRADIRIAGRFIDGPYGYGGYAYPPDGGDIVLDVTEPFIDPSFLIAFVNLLAHEVGHALGLNHVCPPDDTKLMEFWLSTSFEGPQLDDARATHRLYGDRLEEDDGIATAVPLGTLAGTATIGADLVAGTRGFPAGARPRSIDGAGDRDVHAFALAADALVDVVLHPVGVPYLSAPPTNAACNFPVLVDAAAAGDLAFSVVHAGSGQILARRAAAASGADEVILGLPLVAPGPYAVVVEQVATDGIQQYQLTLSATPAAAAIGACGAGNVGVASMGSGPRDVLTIDGNAGGAARRVTVPQGTSFTLALAPPSFATGPCPFAIFAWSGVPRAADALALPGIGTLCFPPSLLAPLEPLAFTLVNASGLDLGPALLSASGAPWSLPVPGGLPAFTIVTIQGVILTPHASGAELAITNAVTLLVP